MGYVVHVKARDLKKEAARRPHVGVLVGPGRLIWLTEAEVFLEERLKVGAADAYVITGFRYRIEQGTLHAPEGFQAEYFRDDRQRVPWKSFRIELRVGKEGR